MESTEQRPFVKMVAVHFIQYKNQDTYVGILIFNF